MIKPVIIGNATLYLGDCLDVLPRISAVDAIITDPPYENEAHTKGRRGNTARDGVSAFFATRPLDFSPMTERNRVMVGRRMADLSAGWVLVFCQVEAAMKWASALEPAKYMRTQIWVKPNGACQFTGDRPGMGYESIVTSWAGGKRSRWNGGGRHGVYRHMTARGGNHQAEKPIDLMDRLVSLFSDPDATVADPFMGSGTTGVACMNLGRKFIGIEIEESYFQIACERIEAAQKQIRLFDDTPESFRPKSALLPGM